MSLKLAILASGNGSNAQAIFDAIDRQALDADIRMVLCNRPGAKALDRAAARGVPSFCLDHTAFADRESYDRTVAGILKEAGADTVVLAGYMRLLSHEFLAAFPGRVLNIHPAILPAFPGSHGTEDAYAWGVKLTGCTVHFVNDDMDCGPIIIQACVPLLQEESLEEMQARIHVLEHRIYPQALQWLAEERLFPQGRMVRLAPADKPAAEPPANAFVWPPLEKGF